MTLLARFRELVEAGTGEGELPNGPPSGLPNVRTPQVGAREGRAAGSDREDAARQLCTKWLTELGFTIVERTFDFSAWPGLWATPVAGLILVLGAFIMWFGLRTGSVDTPLIIGSAFLTVATVGGAFVSEFGPTQLPWNRRQSINLEATRDTPSVTPSVWLVAHLDSKSQTIPMLLRITSVIVCAAAWTIVLTLWMTTFVLRIPAQVFAPFALAAAISAIPLVFTFVGNRGTGALDNASGVLTVLEAVAQLDPTLPIGVLFTSAEELGLAGARNWVAERKPAFAINVDSIDDRGGWLCMVSGDTLKALPGLRGDIQTAARASGATVAVRGVIPGILVDAVAFKDAGWPAVTISRGGIHSLGRIHTSRDTLAHMTGASIAAAATLVRELATTLIVRNRS